jgi:hypothetical protein
MTWSIIARDELTGQFGVAIATRLFAVGARFPYIAAGSGAIAELAQLEQVSREHWVHFRNFLPSRKHRNRDRSSTRLLIRMTLFFLLPLWEKVARTKSAPDEGLRSIDRKRPLTRPRCFASWPPSPTRGEGKKRLDAF